MSTSNTVLLLLMVPAFLGLCAWITMLIAENKGYDRGRGFRAGLLLNVFGIAVFLMLPDNNETTQLLDRDVAIVTGMCPKCGAQSEIFEGFCTTCGAQVGEPSPPGATSPARPEAAGDPAGAAAGRIGDDAGSATTDAAPGADRPATEIVEAFCSACGEETRFFEGFCTNCGATAGSLPGAAATADVPAGKAGDSPPAPARSGGGAAPQRTKQETTEKLCPGCGRVSRFEDGVCTACGARLEI